MGLGSIWVVVNLDGASDKLKDNIDHGSFSEANALKYQMDSLAEKLKSMVSAKAGTVHIAMPDRVVLEVPMSVAEDIPNSLEGYKQFFGSLIAVGMGMDLSEAAAAASKSVNSGEIELFDPSDESFKIYKNDDQSDELMLPPNLFDPMIPKKDEKKAKDRYIAPPSAEQQMQSEAAYLQAIVQQMGGGQPPAPPQQDANQQDQDPRDLLEALHGKQIPGREDPNAEEGEAEGDKESSKSKSSDKDSESKAKEKSKEKSETEDSASEPSDKDNDKLAQLLGTVKTQIPQIMSLAQSNPEAFKQTMNLVHKLIAMGKGRSKGKSAEKSELFDLVEELNKKLIYPVGTRKGNRRKVIVNGKAKWRSLASGQLLDAQGQAISVKSNNAGTKDGSDGIKG